jgi:MarR family transcriptional regulator, organic hydroperoxide resistance regulator
MASDDFIRTQGIPFLAHLLRRVSDRMVADAADFYARAGISAPARTASTLLLLEEKGPQSITGLADTLRQSHPLVITWVRQLRKLGFVAVAADPDDGRRTLVSLTPAGRGETRRMAAALDKLGRAYAALLAEAEADLFEPLWRLDGLIVRGRLAEHLRAFEEKRPA